MLCLFLVVIEMFGKRSKFICGSIKMFLAKIVKHSGYFTKTPEQQTPALVTD